MRSPCVIDGRVAVVIASGTKDPRTGRFSEDSSLEVGLPISAISIRSRRTFLAVRGHVGQPGFRAENRERGPNGGAVAACFATLSNPPRARVYLRIS